MTKKCSKGSKLSWKDVVVLEDSMFVSTYGSLSFIFHFTKWDSTKFGFNSNAAMNLFFFFFFFCRYFAVLEGTAGTLKRQKQRIYVNFTIFLEKYIVNSIHLLTRSSAIHPLFFFVLVIFLGMFGLLEISENPIFSEVYLPILNLQGLKTTLQFE
ncbi:hypothetical protein CXB51_014011 [Gossypium anomalum]|uniref:Uncharacterized protein n=1 Tax=Gossypium anomalum TaxID=47600 RepID=A0A8J5YYJ4_9ROSI|nr:hypothetical protein CXB51_014011 [Gossypium anomalum]